MKVCFITVHYNTPIEVINYLKDIEKFFKQGFQIKVVITDSGSKNENIAAVSEFLKNYSYRSDVQLIDAQENIGYLKGLNKGLEAIESINFQPDYWLLGNNDVYFNDNFLYELQSLQIDDDTLILAPSILNASGIYENPHEKEPISKLRMFYYDLYYSNYFIGMCIIGLYRTLTRLKKNPRKVAQTVEQQEFMPIHFCTGCKFILTPNFFKHYNRLRDDVFLWAEEVLIAYQVWSIGKKMLYCPNLKMHHLLSVATGKLPKRKKYRQMQDAHWKVRKFYK